MIQIGPHKIDRARWDWAAVEDNPFWCPDRQAAQAWEGYLDDVRKHGSSAGAVIEVVAEGVPVGWGDPIYDKLDSDLARALMTINAVKAVEIGAGMAAAALSGEENADEECAYADGRRRRSLSTTPAASSAAFPPARTIVARFAVKPTSSILTPRRTVDTATATTLRSPPRAATTPASASAPHPWARP